MLKLGGMAITVAAGVLIALRFSRFQDRRLSQYTAFLSFLAFLSREIGCFSRPVGEAVRDYSDGTLDEIGFLGALVRTESFSEAMVACRPSLCLSSESESLLVSFAAGFGHGYREEEVRAIAGVREELERQYAAEERQIPRQKRLVHTLCASLSAGVVILLL